MPTAYPTPLTLGVDLPLTTIARVAAELGDAGDGLHDLAIGMEPEDGVIWVYGTEEIEVLAFTLFGVENLREMIATERDSHG